MTTKNTNRKRNAYLLLVMCILCFVSGITIITFGAIQHANPQFSFAGLFKLESYRNLVFSLIPGID
jgi:hypothetical protein